MREKNIGIGLPQAEAYGDGQRVFHVECLSEKVSFMVEVSQVGNHECILYDGEDPPGDEEQDQQSPDGLYHGNTFTGACNNICNRPDDSRMNCVQGRYNSRCFDNGSGGFFNRLRTRSSTRCD